MPNFTPPILLVLLAWAAIITPGPASAAEITAFGQPSGELVTPGRDLKTTCWQNGNKIFERGDLSGIDLGSVLRDQSLSLKKSGKPGSDTIIVPLGRTVCIVSATD